MQTAIEPKRLGLGVLPVTTSLLEDMFCLPEGYRIVGVSYDELCRILNFTLASDHLPFPNDRHSLPQLDLHVTVERLPDASPEYRKITTKVTTPLAQQGRDHEPYPFCCQKHGLMENNHS